MASARYIGIMSGTSLDGVDAVLAELGGAAPVRLESFYLPYSAELRKQLLDLHDAGKDELHRAALLGNELAQCYARAVAGLLDRSGVGADTIAAIGCHGQTVRHRPESGSNYTIQLGNAALLAELTGITVVGDFRSRDIAAGGQGAPLVPAFHQALFSHSHLHRLIVNIGGIANVTSLPPGGRVSGFDCGPGNLLMDAWCLRHTGKTYDENGAWAASGQVIPALLARFLTHPFFSAPPPKSTGRDVFNLSWLEAYLSGNERAEDVQATLLQLTVAGIAMTVSVSFPQVQEVYVCGGGARNRVLVDRIRAALPGQKTGLTDDLGVDADWLEAFAFAWLAQQTVSGKPGNLPEVTGARGARMLGAIYPA